MKCLAENSTEAAAEKHVPLAGKSENGITVYVGAVAHPMHEKHYIEWIELVEDDRMTRKLLEPGNQPQAHFSVEAQKPAIRAYCNIHGLWRC